MNYRRVRILALGMALVAMVAACTGTTGQQVRTIETTTTSTTSTTTPPPDCAETLNPYAQAGQLLMVMVTSAPLAENVIKNGTVGGFGLKGTQSSKVGEEVTKTISDAPIPPFVASDEEGGTVQRLKNKLGALPSAKDMVKGSADGKVDGTPESAAKRLGEYATGMKTLGFNMMFGPVADVGEGSGLGTRSFSDDPAVVSSFVDPIVKAVQAAGVISVVKHWPGIGGGGEDPHNKLAALDPITELRKKDLLPFKSAFSSGAKAVMVSHSVVPGLTGDDEPASLSSKAITGELRGAQGFKGLVITDSLGMGAIVSSTPQDEAAEKAIAAGADIALISGTDSAKKAHQRLTDAITTKRLPTRQVIESVRRVLSAKGISGPCPDLVGAMTKVEADNPLPTTTASVPADDSGGTGTTTTSTQGGASQNNSGQKATTTTIKATSGQKTTTTSSAPTTTVADERDTGINETIPD